MNDKVPCSSTKLIRGGTACSSFPFELKLQLHGQVSNPYSFSIKKNYKASTTTKVKIPAYTKQSWTIPGTYVWTVPQGITKLKTTVAGAGGGGGGSYRHSDAGATGGTGGTGELITKTIIVTVDQQVNITVGAGGSGGGNGYSARPQGYPGSPGGSSTITVGSTVITGRGGGGGGIGTGNSMGAAGSPSYSGGGVGGTGGNYHHEYGSTSGKNGWVYIEYGEGIE